jgi:putative ubiquitin-RnfH superfamily antitoxin RatB of RatAB toxin-antitoxin module
MFSGSVDHVPKSAYLPKALRKAAIHVGIDIEIKTEKAGWFSECVFFEATGEKDKVEMFKAALVDSIRKYKEDCDA